jgi:hypothetical protein
MAKIPLNKFRNRLINVDTALTNIYEVPVNRATIVMNAQVANNTDTEKRISLYISDDRGTTLYPIVKDFPIPGYDSRALLAGRLVLEGIDGTTDITTQEADWLYVKANDIGLTLSISLLETVNKT